MSRPKLRKSRYKKNTTLADVSFFGTYDELIDKFPLDIRKSLYNIVGSQNDPTLISDIHQVYIACQPERSKDRWRTPSKQKQRLEALRESLPRLPRWLLHPDTVGEHEIILSLRKAYNRYHGQAIDVPVVGHLSTHAFDGLIEAPSQHALLLSMIIDRAIKDLPPREELKKRTHNTHEWGFFISLCNIYYVRSGKLPDYKTKTKYLPSGERTTPEVSGKIIDFLSVIYNHYEIRHTRYSLFQRFKKLNKTKTITGKYNTRPQWKDQGNTSKN